MVVSKAAAEADVVQRVLAADRRGSRRVVHDLGQRDVGRGEVESGFLEQAEDTVVSFETRPTTLGGGNSPVAQLAVVLPNVVDVDDQTTASGAFHLLDQDLVARRHLLPKDRRRVEVEELDKAGGECRRVSFAVTGPDRFIQSTYACCRALSLGSASWFILGAGGEVEIG